VDVRSIIINGEYDDVGPDGLLRLSESLDFDRVRNDEGHIVVDALRAGSPLRAL